VRGLGVGAIAGSWMLSSFVSPADGIISAGRPAGAIFFLSGGFSAGVCIFRVFADDIWPIFN